LQGLAAGLEKLWTAQEKTVQLLESLAAKVDSRSSLEQDDIADLVQEEVARVYFDIAKVEQGEGNKLQREFIKRIEEKEKAQLPASVKERIKKSFVPAVRYCIGLVIVFTLTFAFALQVRKRRTRVADSLRLLLGRTFEQLKPKQTPLEFRESIAGM
jgi:uncharacterized protein (DUF2267 family)